MELVDLYVFPFSAFSEPWAVYSIDRIEAKRLIDERVSHGAVYQVFLAGTTTSVLM